MKDIKGIKKVQIKYYKTILTVVKWNINEALKILSLKPETLKQRIKNGK
ncbi:MAG: hypothetical protein N3A65_07285 [candidate division WOR-3 bacterium]|nr:hypothetical protein [candidate division WOR-3 bacterium]